MVGALGRQHHGNARDLDHPGIIGAERLFLDDRQALDAVMRADPRGALGQNLAAFIAFTDVGQGF